jgi:hypothetical protein
MMDRNDDRSRLLEVGWYVDVHSKLGGAEVEIIDLGGSLGTAQCGEGSGRENGETLHFRKKLVVMRTELRLQEERVPGLAGKDRLRSIYRTALQVETIDAQRQFDIVHCERYSGALA